MAQKKGRVLCVDDEPNILRSLQWLLQKEFEVMTATSGADGLALVRSHDFDVVISDQRMPGMMGSEFLREVSKLAPRAMRILLTGYSDLQAILRSVNEGEVFRFVNKPWNISELPKLVGQAAEIARTDQAGKAAAEAGHAAGAPAAAESVLLIDDDPAMLEQVRAVVGPNAHVTYASNLTEAVQAFSDDKIGVVISETRVGNMDATRLLKVLKQQHPEVVTVVFSSESDADAVIGLINQGQIYRFIPKPVKSGFLKVILTSAVLKYHQLQANPAVSRRHAVDRLAAGSAESLVKDVQLEAQRLGSPPAARAANDSAAGFLDRITGGFRRLFGAH